MQKKALNFFLHLIYYGTIAMRACEIYNEAARDL